MGRLARELLRLALAAALAAVLAAALALVALGAARFLPAQQDELFDWHTRVHRLSWRPLLALSRRATEPALQRTLRWEAAFALWDCASTAEEYEQLTALGLALELRLFAGGSEFEERVAALAAKASKALQPDGYRVWRPDPEPPWMRIYPDVSDVGATHSDDWRARRIRDLEQRALTLLADRELEGRHADLARLLRAQGFALLLRGTGTGIADALKLAARSFEAAAYLAPKDAPITALPELRAALVAGGIDPDLAAMPSAELWRPLTQLRAGHAREEGEGRVAEMAELRVTARSPEEAPASRSP